MRLVDRHTAAAASQIVAADVAQLDASIGARGYAQNSDKLVIIPMLRRPQEHWRLAQTLQHHNVQHEHRHLGTIFSGLMNEGSEIGAQVRSCNRGWSELRGLWTARAPWQVKLLAFRARCLAAAYSGLVGVAVTPRQLHCLHAALVGKLRFLLAIRRGPRPEGEFRADSAAEVWRKCRLCPSGLDLTVQRLRWLQRALAAPHVHAQTLMGWFGDLALGGPPTLGGDGRPTPAANPHAHLFWADLQCIASQTEMQEWGRRWDGDSSLARRATQTLLKCFYASTLRTCAPCSSRARSCRRPLRAAMRLRRRIPATFACCALAAAKFAARSGAASQRYCITSAANGVASMACARS